MNVNLFEGLAGAMMISLLQRHSPTGLLMTTFQSYFRRNIVASVHRRVGNGASSVDCFACRTADSIVSVFLPGIQDSGSNAPIANGYAAAGRFRDDYPANVSAVNAAIEVSGLFASLRGDPATSRVAYYGHSYGGMVCECMAAFRSLVGNNPSRVFTYGSPKVFLRRYGTRAFDTDRARFMNYGDPVPLVPNGPLPGGLSIALFIGLQRSLGRTVAISDFVHGPGGLLIGNGPPVESLDARGAINPFESLQRWLDGDTSSVNAHLISSYVNVLSETIFLGEQFRTTVARPEIRPPREQAFNLVPEFNLTGLIPSTPNVVIGFPLPFALADGVARVGRVDSARSTVTVGNVTYRAISQGAPMANAKMKPMTGFTRSKVDGKWYVYWAGTLVAQTATGSRAKTLCKRMNAALRYWSNLLWYGPELPVAMEAFLQRAVVGDGYTPPLQAAG